MTRTRLGAVLATAVAIGAVLISTAGAVTRMAPGRTVHLSTVTSITAYLRSLGVDPSGVVIQRDKRNYAGPDCPGPKWNCTTSMNVVQVTAAGGSNEFRCTGMHQARNTCLVVQSGPDNTAECSLRATGGALQSQRCEIIQEGTTNFAIVDQVIEQQAGSDQDARQFAHVDQTATDRNESQIHQSGLQDAKTGSVQNQNVHQVALVEQIANQTENVSRVQQNQQLSESGAARSQSQNLAGLPHGFTDCDLAHKPGSEPNACANIVQTVSDLNGGTNESQLEQIISEQAETTSAHATQIQERADTGIEAHVDQTNPAGVGTNRKVTMQDARQSAQGPPGTSQTQIIDPNCCGIGTTTGGAVNADDFRQAASQSASEGGSAFQLLKITGDTNHEVGPPQGAAAAPTTGATHDTCRIAHEGRNAADSIQFTITIAPCVGPQSVTTTCVNPGTEQGPVHDPVGCTTSRQGAGGELALTVRRTFSRI